MDSKTFSQIRKIGGTLHEKQALIDLLIWRMSELARANKRLVRQLKHQTRARAVRGAWGGLAEQVLHQSPFGVVMCNREGSITRVNATARRLARMDPEGKPSYFGPQIWGEMFDADGTPVPAEEWPWMRALRGETIRKECHLVESSESSREMLFIAAPIRCAAKQIIAAVAMMIDISEQKQRELLMREEAVRKERRRMAGDLHDTLCQGLNAIALQLEMAESDFTGNSEESEQHVQRAHVMARASLAEARRSMWTLRHESIESKDPAAALSTLAAQLFAGSTVKLDFSQQGKARGLPDKMGGELLRIGREALTNVLKHAQATKVQIELAYKEREVQLSVDDDGQGFVLAPCPGSESSLGLINMRERAEAMGGNITLSSHPGGGTRVVARMPFVPSVLPFPTAA